MDDQKKNYPLWKVIVQIVLRLGMIFVVPPLLLVLWLGGSEWMKDQKVPEVREQAEAYLSERYPGNDFEIQNAYHSWYDNVYYVKVQSRSSADTYFTLTYDGKPPELIADSYERRVQNRGNTKARIIQDYEAQAEAVLNTLPGIDRVVADFVHCSKQTSLEQYSVDLSMDSLALELDGQYDAAALGWDHGTLELWFVEKPEDLNIHRLLERLREVDAAMTQAGVGYRLIEIRLVDAPDFDYTQKYYIYDILREDLYSEDPLAVLQEMWEEQEANRQALKAQWTKSDQK